MSGANSVTFIATKYKNQPTQISFYTKSGQLVSFPAEQKVPRKEVIHFTSGNGKKGKK